MKKFDKAKMNDADLDGVAGGNILETKLDAIELQKRGLLPENEFSCSAVRNVLKNLGYAGYQDRGGLVNANTYTDKQGNVVSREQFWKQFNANK